MTILKWYQIKQLGLLLPQQRLYLITGSKLNTDWFVCNLLKNVTIADKKL